MKSFAGATEVAKQYPQYSSQILAAARTSFIKGDHWAFFAGIVAVLVGAAVVFFAYPKLQDEKRLLAEYQRQDSG